MVDGVNEFNNTPENQPCSHFTPELPHLTS